MPTASRIAFAAVWLVMGLGAKILGLVPRHQEIVARILGDDHAVAITRLIGCGEIGLAVWILSGVRPKLCAAVQIGLVAVMNLIEFVFARDLLLFGGANLVPALGFIAVLALSTFRPLPPCVQH